MKKKGILLVNQSSGCLMVDIVNAFNRSGKYINVVLLAGEINIRPSIPDDSVRIIKTVQYNKKSIFTRALTWLLAFFQVLWIVLIKDRHYELFLVSNPPLTTFIPLLSRKKFSLLIYDIYPDTLINQRIISKKSFVTKTWQKVNKIVFGRAQKVFTINKDMKKVVSQYVEENKIEVIYNWVHNEHLSPIEKEENIFLKSHNLVDKFIILYSGNMGISHDIDILVDVAAKLKSDDRFRFIFIGEGAKKAIIGDRIRQLELQNCLLLPFQELSVLPYSIGASDISVVTTDSTYPALSVPSKTYSYLSTGSALICIADKNSELGQMIENEKVGKCFVKEEINEITEFILLMANDKQLLQEYKTNSRQLSYDYSPENAKKFVKILNT
jgi:glycosyltransferase involved in cell wall biosynthesis